MLTSVGQWLMTTGLHIAMVVVSALLVTRVIRWIAERVSRHLAEGDQREPSVRSETVKHRQAGEAVTLRVTKLRTSEGEVYTVPNGMIAKSRNLSKDWASAVVDVPVPANADINQVNDVLRAVAVRAANDEELAQLLLDEPQLMGVESIELDTVNVRMVARTLPGKQFEVGRRLRALVVAALRREGIALAA